MNKNVILTFALMLVLSLLLAACESGTGSTIRFTSPIKTCKTVDVPYQVAEEYDVNLKYEVVEASRTTTFKGFLDVWALGIVKVRNVDSETGTFTVTQFFKTLERGEKSFQSSQYIMPGETKEFEEEYDITTGEDFTVQYRVIPGTKKETRTVTKYKQEEICD